MPGSIRVHPDVVEAARTFGAEHDGLELLAHRLGVHLPRLSMLLNHPVVDTARNRELIGRLTTIVGAYVRTRAARRQPVVKQEAA